MFTLEGTHEYFTRTKRHWSARSEAYTGADSLLTAQRLGWQVQGLAYREQFMLSGGRHTTLYHVKLVRGTKNIFMPIVDNPFLQRIFVHYDVKIVPIIEAEFAETGTKLVSDLFP